MNRVEQFNQELDHHKYVVIPITEDIGYMRPDDSGSGWGTWHLNTKGALFTDKVQIELD